MNKLVHSDISKWVDTFYFFLESDLSPERLYPIILGGSCGSKEKFIFYNVEQLTRTSPLQIILNISKNPKCIDIWDYSKANINILHKYGINAKHYPPILPEKYLSKLREFRKVGQSYDFGFSGCDSPRRAYILKELENAGFKTNYIVELYGEERDKELAKCKVLLNIHCFPDFQIFESARCEPWLAIGVPVISETSLDDDPRCINVSYDNFVKTAIEFIKKEY
jgi:hypothetical protein